MIVNRLTMSRDGMSPSYHNADSSQKNCPVRTEYGADAWKQVIQAGFSECRIISKEYPAAQVLVGVK